MCIVCHSSLTNEEVIEQLKKELNSKNQDFESWNETSLHKLFIISTGYNGLEARILASKYMDLFLIWKRNNKQHGSLSYEYVLQVTEYIKTVQDMFADEGLMIQEIQHKINTGSLPRGYPDVFIQEEKPVVQEDIEREINVSCFDRLHYSFLHMLANFSCIRV